MKKGKLNNIEIEYSHFPNRILHYYETTYLDGTSHKIPTHLAWEDFVFTSLIEFPITPPRVERFRLKSNGCLYSIAGFITQKNILNNDYIYTYQMNVISFDVLGINVNNLENFL